MCVCKIEHCIYFGTKPSGVIPDSYRSTNYSF